jgi:hypothetical protein
MKKVLFAVLALGLLAGNVFGYDFYVGGSGLYHAGDYRDDGNSRNDYGYKFNPTFGYNLDEFSDVYIAVGFGGGSGDGKYTMRHNDSIAVGEAYSVKLGYEKIVVEFGKFNVYLAAEIEYETAHSGTLTAAGGTSNVTNINSVSLSITPNVQYSISDRITLFAALNFLEIAAGVNKYKNDANSTQTDTYFGSRANADNAFNTNNFQVGFFYNF